MEIIIILLLIVGVYLATAPLRRGFPGVAKFQREREILKRARKGKPRAMATRSRDLPTLLRRQGF